MFLVLSGMAGRLLDLLQARVIATEADRNRVGITRSVEERLLELSLTIERLSAGKSAEFKQVCQQAMHYSQPVPQMLSTLSSREIAEFQRAQETFTEYVALARSLRRQQRAQALMRAWRLIHIPLAGAAVLVIVYHSLFELWKMLILHS